MRSLRPALTLSLLACALAAQQHKETFAYPDGPVVPGWTQQAYTWQIASQRLVPTGGAAWHYITLDAFPSVGDCVVDVEVYYPTVTKLYFGGICARHPGNTTNSGLVMTKIQDNFSAGSGTYNYLWMYEQPGGAQSLPFSPGTLAANVRMIVKGRTSQQMADTNMDGVYDAIGVVRPFAAATTNNLGFVGCDGYNNAELDNFRFFDGVLIEDTTPGNAPKLGTTYKLTFAAPLNNGNPTPWTSVLSLGKAGIPLDGTRALPLSLDAMFLATLGISGGLLMSTAPEGTVSIPIPGNPAIVGLKVFAGAVTLDGTRPFAVSAISNEHQFTITQ